MTAADRDTLLTLVQQWHDEADETLRQSLELSKQQAYEGANYARGLSDKGHACAKNLTALLARLITPEPEKNGGSDVV